MAVRTGRNRPAGRRIGAARPLAAPGLLVLLGALVTGCGSSLFATTTGARSAAASSTTSTAPSASTTSTVPPLGGVAVGIPVGGCTSDAGASGGTGVPGATGAGGAGDGWRPSLMLAPVPTALVGQVELYSDGVHTVLAPAGWTCAELTPAQAETELAVYPSNDPEPPTAQPPAPGTDGVFAFFDNTGEPEGVSLVCPFFAVPSWQQAEANCTSKRAPAGEQTSMATPDIASVTDPSGVFGSLPGSGGPHPVSGAVIFPQVMPAVQYGDRVDVDEESCSLTRATLCPAVLADFEVREFPVPSAPGSASASTSASPSAPAS